MRRARGSTPPSGSYSTLSSTHRTETRVRGSRFIATAFHSGDEETARRRLQEVREEYHDATHHGFALRLAGPHDAPRERSQDDGEPPGTAGLPILQAIRSELLFDTAVVVSRYFGGTKLGRGGLARAYRDAARLALAGAPRTTRFACSTLRILVPLDRDGESRHLIARHGGCVTGATYADPEWSVLTVTIPVAAIPALQDDLRELTRGAGRVQPVG